MGKIGLAFRAFFRVLRDPEFAKLVISAPDSSPKQELTQPDEALALLSYLQEEGRLVDFLQEDISEFDEEQIGAAVRPIHEGCQKALHKLFQIKPIVQGEEGSETTVEKNFDPGAIKLVGDLRGDPPFQGCIKHHGWKITKADFPPKRETPTVLAKAEIELG